MVQAYALVCALLAFAAGAAVPSQAEVWGTWKGTWEQNDGGGGGLTLVLQHGQDGKDGGRISVTGGPVYDATLKSVTVEKNELTLRYDAPDESSIEIVLTGKVDGAAVAGTWSAREKGTGNEVGTGTWKAAKN